MISLNFYGSRFTAASLITIMRRRNKSMTEAISMGGPVSSVVTNLCMEEIEELAQNQCTPSPKKWFVWLMKIFFLS